MATPATAALGQYERLRLLPPRELKMSIAGKVAVVTGGGGGIGRATCLRLNADGASIAVWDIDRDAAQDTAAQIADAGGRAIACTVDVASAASVSSALDETHWELGRVAILINNAALTGSVTFDDMTEQQWDRMIEIDLKGPFLCCKAILPEMVAEGWGRIVNITSSSIQIGSPCMAHYIAAKAGLQGLTRALAVEYAASGITINSIPPGYIDTPTLRRNQAEFPSGHGANVSVEQAVTRFPMRRAGKPEDIAAACAFLASEEANYITGQTIGVNGGRFLT
ncbi:MAG: 3-oxoacyl-ACP reductase FabG [Novosphingobium sp.]